MELSLKVARRELTEMERMRKEFCQFGDPNHLAIILLNAKPVRRLNVRLFMHYTATELNDLFYWLSKNLLLDSNFVMTKLGLELFNHITLEPISADELSIQTITFTKPVINDSDISEELQTEFQYLNKEFECLPEFSKLEKRMTTIRYIRKYELQIVFGYEPEQVSYILAWFIKNELMENTSRGFKRTVKLEQFLRHRKVG